MTHPFDPVFDEHSEVLLLGTFPSVKSRENQFYYGNPQNRFWKVLSALAGEAEPDTVPEKTAFLLRHHIAVWDVIAECEITGSSDSSIRGVTPNDMAVILEHAPIRAIYANGAKAYDLYLRYCAPAVECPITKLPSTSPANASWSLERLIGEWGEQISVHTPPKL